jgi:hypothetical protein
LSNHRNFNSSNEHTHSAIQEFRGSLQASNHTQHRLHADLICAMNSMALRLGLPVRVLVDMRMDSEHWEMLQQVQAVMVRYGMQQHLAPVFSRSTTSQQLAATTADVQRFLAVLGEPGNAQLYSCVMELFSHMQWMLQTSYEEQQQYVRLCEGVIKAATPLEQLSRRVATAYHESSKLLQQNFSWQLAAAEATAAGGSDSFSSASSSCHHACAGAYSAPTGSSTAVGTGELPGYASGSSRYTFGSSSSRYSFGSSSSTAASGCDRQKYSGQPKQLNSSSAWQQTHAVPVFEDVASSNTQGCGDQPQLSSQCGNGLPAQPSSSDSWQQVFTHQFFGDAPESRAGLFDTANHAVLSSSNTAAAAGSSLAAAVVEPGTPPAMLPGSTAFGGATSSQLPAAPEENLWRLQPDSSSSFFAAANSMAPQVQDPSDAFGDAVARGPSGFPCAVGHAACSSKHSSSSTGDGSSAAPGAASVPGKLGSVYSSTCSSMPLDGSSSNTDTNSGADLVGADIIDAASPAAAAAVELVEVSGVSSNGSGSAWSCWSGRTKVLRCMSVCALGAVRILEGCAARCSAV